MLVHDVIKFYSVSHDYGEFSNFYVSNFKLKVKSWKSVEHYFQAQKFAGTEYEVKIQKSSTPHQAAELGRSRKVKIRNDWEKVKDNVMFEALSAKFSQNNFLREKLISTGTSILIEDSKNDNYWGIGADGKGLNKLGKMLMKLRDV